jgi:hypothetical protein
MATGKTTEELLESLLELQLDTNKMLTRSMGATGAAGSSASGSAIPFKKYAKSFEELISETQRQTVWLKKSAKEANSFSKMLSPIPSALSSLTNQIEELDEAIKDQADAAKVRQLQEEKAHLLTQAARNDNIENMKKLTTSLKQVGKTGLSAAGSFVKGLQSGQSGIELSSSLMTAGLEMTGTASEATGNAIGTAGQIMMHSTSPALKILGATAAVVGPVLGLLGEGASKLAKFGVEVLSKEVEKTVKAFNDASSAGALFGRGMDDLRAYSGQAGLTVDQYSNVLKNNASILADSGYTVSGAAKIVAGVTSNLAKQTGKSGNTLQNELLNLGYSFEDQASLVAQMTSDLKKSGGTATNAQMAQATMEMGKNMRVVADIMGEDAKQKMAQAKKEAEQYAFNAKVREIARKTNDPGLLKRVETSLSLMDETQRRAAMQATVLGGAVTDVSANVLGQADAGREFARNLEAGNASLTGLTGGFARASENFDKNYGDTARAISTGAIAGASGLSDLAKSADSLGQQQFKLTEENLKSAVAAADAQANASGKLQNAVIGAETAAQNLKLSLQNELTPAIAQFATVSKQMLGEVQKMLKDVGIGQGNENSSITSSALGVGKFIGRQVLEIGGGALGGLAFGGATGGIGALAGGIGGYQLGSKAADMLGFANGGISSTTNPSGVLAMVSEGGINEAHVPLPDGKTIPVDLGNFSGDLASGLKAMAAAISTLNSSLGKTSPSSSTTPATQSSSTPSSSTTPATQSSSTAEANVPDNLSMLVSQNKSLVDLQKSLLSTMKDIKDIQQKLLHVSA